MTRSSTAPKAAITMDEAGHLVAMPFAAVKDSWGKYSEDIKVMTVFET